MHYIFYREVLIVWYPIFCLKQIICENWITKITSIIYICRICIKQWSHKVAFGCLPYTKCNPLFLYDDLSVPAASIKLTLYEYAQIDDQIIMSLINVSDFKWIDSELVNILFGVVHKWRHAFKPILTHPSSHKSYTASQKVRSPSNMSSQSIPSPKKSYFRVGNKKCFEQIVL